ncbi:MAG: hypothetical protein JWQ45_1228 [Blastococcus sp.]|nr:hypothetical protein [Blastococcus sp.]
MYWDNNVRAQLAEGAQQRRQRSPAVAQPSGNCRISRILGR